VTSFGKITGMEICFFNRKQYLSFGYWQICHRSTNIKLYGKY